jgi:hypothetical protein
VEIRDPTSSNIRFFKLCNCTKKTRRTFHTDCRQSLARHQTRTRPHCVAVKPPVDRECVPLFFSIPKWEAIESELKNVWAAGRRTPFGVLLLIYTTFLTMSLLEDALDLQCIAKNDVFTGQSIATEWVSDPPVVSHFVPSTSHTMNSISRTPQRFSGGVPFRSRSFSSIPLTFVSRGTRPPCRAGCSEDKFWDSV